MENVAFFFHILGVMLFVAGIVVAGAAFEAARRRQRPSEVALLLGLTRVGVVLVAVGTVLAGVFGLWLVHLGKWGYGTSWVDASIVLSLVVIGLGGVGGRRPKQARLLASRLVEQDAGSNGELRALLDDRVSRAENYVSLLLVPVIIALMVFKP
jgi:MFS family permease